MQDRYGNELTTGSAAARDAYVVAMDRFLAAEAGIEEGFGEALDHDPDFALAHIGIARYYQIAGRAAEIKPHLERANAASGLDAAEARNVELSTLLLSGKARDAYPLIRKHLIEHPRDAMLAQTCMGVFGLIGFSGEPGREAEQLAFSTALAPHYGDDWWFLGVHSFSQMEAGQTGPAERSIERSLAQRPTSANGVHYRSHLYYENGESDAGLTFVKDWMKGYSRDGFMHTHISWHIGLWALEQGDEDTLWSTIDANVMPGASDGPPINIVSDASSILFRAELAGIDVTAERWRKVSEFAARAFTRPGLAFVDVHAALSHAMAGERDALEHIITHARGSSADLVRQLAKAFRAMAAKNWVEAEAELLVAVRDHARIGGSKAQRDLIELALAFTMLRQGRGGEARRILSLRRPGVDLQSAVAGLADA